MTDGRKHELKVETIDTLKLYVDKNDEAQSLVLTKLLATNVFGQSISFDQRGQPTKVENSVEIDREYLKSLATTIRIFTLKNDRLTFDELGKITDPALTHFWHDEIDKCAKAYSKLRSGYPLIPKKVEAGELVLPFQRPSGTGAIRVVVDEKTLTNGQIFDTFIYGDLVHVNRGGKRERFESWKQNPHILQMLQDDFVTILIQILCLIGPTAWACKAELIAERLCDSSTVRS